MLNAFRYLLCSKLCQHNRRVPSKVYIHFTENPTIMPILFYIGIYQMQVYSQIEVGFLGVIQRVKRDIYIIYFEHAVIEQSVLKG